MPRYNGARTFRASSDNNTSPAPYSKIAFGQVLPAFLLLALSCVNPSLSFCVHIGLIAASLVNASLAIRSLFVLVLIKFLNPALITYTSSMGLIFWIALLVSTLKIIATNRQYILNEWLLIVFYCAFLLMSSIITSRYPTISSFKIVVFGLTVMACMLGVAHLSKAQKRALAVWIMMLVGLILLVSIPMFLVPSVGFNKNGKGFQGLLNHPQVFGVFISPLLAYFAANLMAVPAKKSRFLIPVVVALLVLIVTTQARTAMLAVVVSLGLVFFINMQWNIRRRQKVALIRCTLAAIAVSVAVAGALQLNSEWRQQFKSYITKERGDGLGEAFYRSRGKIVETHFDNFIDSPLIGNGFGVFATDEQHEEIIYVIGIPISAAVEKGFVVFAALEEAGLVGFLFFIALICKMTSRAIENANPGIVAAFFCCLLVNFGEAVFFAPGGIGLYFWILMGLCVGLSDRYASKRRRRVRRRKVQLAHEALTPSTR